MRVSNIESQLPDHPTVAEFMTSSPATVNAELRVMDAYERMYIDNIHHLPVVDGKNRVVGMLSSRDVARVATIEGSKIDEQLVADRMNPRPYTCETTTPLDEVAAELEKRRLDSVLVTQEGKLAGVFTTTDALVAVRSLIAGERLEAIHPPEHLPTQDGPSSPNEVHLRRSVPRETKLNWGLFPTP